MKKTIGADSALNTTNENIHGAAYVALGGASLFLILLFLLHFLEPEFDPSWRFISEYSLGNYGWVMKLAFFSLAMSCAALFAAIKSEIKTTGGKIGLAALLITAAGLFIAGVSMGIRSQWQNQTRQPRTAFCTQSGRRLASQVCRLRRC